MAQISLIRWLQLFTAILGLIFASSAQINGLLVFAFVVALVYMIIVFIGSFTGRDLFSGKAQTIVEILIAILILIVAIYCTMLQGKEIVFILAIVCAYTLTAMLFITSYTGH